MRAYHKPAPDAPASVMQIAMPEPGPGQIRLRIAACGLNFADLLMLKGQYQDTPAAPFTLGMEGAGTTEALGEGTAGPAIGSRVAVFGGQGGLAEYGCFDASRAVPLPDVMSMTDAAAFLITYGTSHLALEHRARLQPGERLLVSSGPDGTAPADILAALRGLGLNRIFIEGGGRTVSTFLQAGLLDDDGRLARHETWADMARRDLEAVRLTSAHHHQTRDECRACPLVQMCKGSCMFLEGDLWRAACDVSFTYNLALFAAALFYLSGRTLTRIAAPEGGFIRRPGSAAVEAIRLADAHA